MESDKAAAPARDQHAAHAVVCEHHRRQVFRRQGRDHAVFKNDIDIIGRGERDQRFRAVDFLVGSCTVRQLSALLAPGRGNIGEQPGQQIGTRQVGDIEPVRIARAGQPDRRQAIARSIEPRGSPDEFDAPRKHIVPAHNGDRSASGRQLTLIVRKSFFVSMGCLPGKDDSILHPLRAQISISAAAAPPRAYEVGPQLDKPAAFPRRIDRIATEAHGRFVVILGICTLLALVFSIVVQIDRVTRASGRIVTQQTKQEVQHLEGGIIAEILVKQGDTVVAGQPLMRVENSFFKSELAQAAIELGAKRARILRLDAETSGAKEIKFPPEVAAASQQVVGNEMSLFRRRQANLNEQLSILAQQQRQKEIELSELRSRQPSVTRERQISEERLSSLNKLSSIGAASNNERLEAERVLQQAISRLSDLAHEIPRTEAALAEIGQRKAEAVSRFQADAEKERAQTATDLEKLMKSIEALQDRSRRSDVNARVGGTINKLNVTTIGGVVKPGEALVEIVPADGLIEVEMKLSPADRADVWPGQRAIVKVSAYEYSVYGGLSARVLDISPDAHQDERGIPYFRVRLEADAAALGPAHPVLPGMLADVDVIGNRQSVLGTILKPLRRLKDNALRQ